MQHETARASLDHDASLPHPYAPTRELAFDDDPPRQLDVNHRLPSEWLPALRAGQIAFGVVPNDLWQLGTWKLLTSFPSPTFPIRV